MSVEASLLPTIKMALAGQSPWLDYLSRDMIASGRLKQLIGQGVLGLTSNPSIFQKAISQSNGYYDRDISRLSKKYWNVLEIYDALTIADIQSACDLFSQIYRDSHGEHGYVSLEVLPNLAYRTEQTLSDARRLNARIKRPNVMIKIPATEEGIHAIRRALVSGININATLIFSLEHYRQAAEAYIAGLEDRIKAGGDISKIRSVASVFVSRIDAEIDKQLQSMIQETTDPAKKKNLQSLLGQAAIANSKRIYQEFEKIFSSARFQKLRQKGAQVQKVLWGSTSVKNPNYPDMIYVEPLIGKETINTMPQETLDAVLDHGEIRENTVLENKDGAQKCIDQLHALGIDLSQVGRNLQTQGVQLFSDAFASLMTTLEIQMEKSLSKSKKIMVQDRYRYQLRSQQKDMVSLCQRFEIENLQARFFKEDPTLWKSEEYHQKSIANRLGWLKVHEWVLGKLYELDQLTRECREEGFRDIVLLGMGGSSLSAEVMSLICPRKPKSPRFRILDSTDPLTIKQLEQSLNLKKTLFIVASKSGSTIETTSQYYYFAERMEKKYGKPSKAEMGNHFIAITDKGSRLETLAKERSFRRCFINPSNIGGRYSALSLFGLVPAALMGADVRSLVRSAKAVYEKTYAGGDMARAATIYLGIALGFLASKGMDKLTFILSKSLLSFGSWLEQLIAESTGKEKKGILPIDRDLFQDPNELSDDRVYVAIRLNGEKDASYQKRLNIVRKLKAPLIEITWNSPEALGGEFLRWEIVTAMSCLPLCVNPFDEPNVTESKEITGDLLKNFNETGRIQMQTPPTPIKKLQHIDSFLSAIPKGGFLAFLLYTESTQQIVQQMDRIRKLIRLQWTIPVLLGFGPRYLHSIGQYYKGGTPHGYFIELIKQETISLKIPQAAYTFGDLKLAQAAGDYQAIKNKNLPIIMIDLGKNVFQGLKQLERILARSSS